MPPEGPEAFVYPGTSILRNRCGARTREGLKNAEVAAYLAGAESLPPAGFEPDMRGLKGVHRHLFGDVYEWAGCARHERVVVDGKVIEPRPYVVAKDGVEFASSEVLEN